MNSQKRVEKDLKTPAGISKKKLPKIFAEDLLGNEEFPKDLMWEFPDEFHEQLLEEGTKKFLEDALGKFSKEILKGSRRKF